MVIKRGDDTIFGGETSTGRMYRSLPELVDYLGRCNRFPHGVYLLTGSGIPMPDGLSVVSGDEVRIQIDPIGKLVNTAQVVGNQ
jgi:2-dehydro-3-deoxy-D-arabinonate dehydratase